MEPRRAVVDSVEFLVLVDNSLDSLSSVPRYVTLEWPRLMRNGMKELSGEWQCCANHGLSLGGCTDAVIRRIPSCSMQA